MTAIQTTQPPDWQSLQPQKLLFAVGFGTALSLVGDATLYTVLPTHTADAGITLGAVGILLGINRGVRLVFNGVAGWLYDRLSQRGLFILGLFLGALSNACYALAPGFWILFVGRVVWGLAWSLIWVGGGTIILNSTAPSERGRWTGLYQTWFFFGAGLGAFAGGLLTDQVGYRQTLWLAALLNVLSSGLVWVWLPALPKTMKDSTSQVVKPPTFWRQSDLWVTAAMQGINRFCISGVLMATMGLLVKQELAALGTLVGVATLTGLLMAGRTLIGMVAAPLAGKYSDALGSRWRVMLQTLFMGVFAMSLLAIRSVPLIILGIIGSAMINGAIQSLTITLTGDLFDPRQRGKAISVLHTIGDLGSALGPPLAYAFLFHVGLSGLYLFCAGLFVIGLLLVALRHNESH